MKCPVCEDVALSISSRDGVEIDFCPQCRGVWLDRGELDKILDRVAAAVVVPTAAPTPPPPRYDERPRHEDRGRYDERPQYERGDDGRDRYDDRRDDRRYDKKRRKRSFLDDMFDAFD